MKPLSTATALGASALLLGACAGQPDVARPAFSLGSAATVGDLSLPMERGKAYFGAGQYGLALAAFRDAFAADPGSVRALNAIAATFDQLGRFDLADRYYSLALELEPRSVEVLNNLGYSHLLRGDPAEAEKYLTRASLIDSEQPVVQANLRLAAGGAAGPEMVAAAPAAGALNPAPPAPAQTPAAASRPEEGPFVQLVRIARGVKALFTRPAVPEAGATAVASAAPVPVAPAAGRSVFETAHGGLALVAFRPAAAIEDPSWEIEVSNGTGREAMAARMRGYLASVGVGVDRLTNDASFQNAESRIFYRPNAEAAARALRIMLPAEVALEPRADQRSDVRLLLGADLLEFDAGLMGQVAFTDE